MLAKCVRYIKNKGITAFGVKITERIRWKALSRKYMKENATLANKYLKGSNIKEDTLISICVPLYNTDKKYLVQLLDSVVGQTYGNWQLCLADASDTDAIGHIVREYDDSRIKYAFLNQNKGISQNTNAAANMADGEYIALLDHDDLYDRQALMCFKRAIDGGADLIYCDEANFSKDPKKPDIVHFKPDFGIYNLRGNNFVCHLLMFKKQLFEQVGGFRKEFDGSQDHDLTLRLAERSKKICHIPVVLYYWRVHKNSVASDISAKPYCIDRGRQAVQQHLERMGVDALVQPLKNTAVYRVNYGADNTDKTDIFEDMNSQVLDLDFEVLCQKQGQNPFESNFLTNWGKKYLFFASRELNLSQRDKELLFRHIIQKNVGAVCGVITQKNRIVSGGMYLDGDGYACAYRGTSTKSDGYMQRLNYTQNISLADGRFCMVDLAAVEDAGGFDRRLLGQDCLADLCLRLEEAGYDILLVPTARAEIRHDYKAAASPAFIYKNKERINRGEKYYRTEIL